MSTLTLPRRSPSRPQPALSIPQEFRPKAVVPLRILGSTVSDDAISSFSLGEDTRREGTPKVVPLPSRQCALLLIAGSLACYGLGYAVVSAFHHLVTVLT